MMLFRSKTKAGPDGRPRFAFLCPSYTPANVVSLIHGYEFSLRWPAGRAEVLFFLAALMLSAGITLK
jgi:hypothetical protein